jgi:hypothetical protein
LVIGARDKTPFSNTPETKRLLLGAAVDSDVMERACRKLASRVAKYGAVPACSAASDEVLEAARLPLACAILSQVMLGRLSHSEHRHCLHCLLAKLLRSGDAFAVFQEPVLVKAAARHQGQPSVDRHQLLVLVADRSAVDVDARRCTNVLDFAWPRLPSAVPTYQMDLESCECDIVQVPDATHMARALVNCAATYVMRPGGCTTALYHVGRYLAPSDAVAKLLKGAVASAFDQ